MKPVVMWGLVEIVPNTGKNGFIVQCGLGLKKSLVLGLHNLKLDIPPIHCHSGMQI